MTWEPKEYQEALRRRLEILLEEHLQKGYTRGTFSVNILHLDKKETRKDGVITYGTSLLGRLLRGQKRYWTLELLHKLAELSGGITLADLLSKIERENLPRK